MTIWRLRNRLRKCRVASVRRSLKIMTPTTHPHTLSQQSVSFSRRTLKVMYLALGSVHPTTLAVGNTMKRVFIVVASLLVFKTPISQMGMVGSAIAVGGVLVYSLARQHYGVVDRNDSKRQ